MNRANVANKKVIKTSIAFFMLACVFLYADYLLIEKISYLAWLTAAPPDTDDSYGRFWANMLSFALVSAVLLEVFICVFLTRRIIQTNQAAK